MAYLSSTCGSSAVVPVLVSQGIASTAIGSTVASTSARGAIPKHWFYASTHTQAEVAAAGFITDGRILGMSIGDVLMVVGSTTMVQSQHIVNAVSSTGITVSAGLCVSSAS